MEKEVRKMSLRLDFTEGRRLVFGLNSGLLAVAIRRAYHKIYAGSRYVFTLAHDLIHWLFPELFLLDDSLPSLCSLLDWFDPDATERSNGNNRMNAIVFSERLRVSFLCLAERSRASINASRKASPRHQDRGSGDAVSDNDNLKKERKIYIAAVAAVRATFIYRLSLLQEVFANAGRRNSGSIRRYDGTLLQRTGVRLLPTIS